MITCPICGRPVHPTRDERDTNAFLTEGSAEDFICPTMIDVAPGRRWHHYQRFTNNGEGAVYSIVYPPFEIIWFSNGRLAVEQFDYRVNVNPSIGNPMGQTVINRVLLMVKPEASFQDFLQTATRFKGLVAFS